MGDFPGLGGGALRPDSPKGLLQGQGQREQLPLSPWSLHCGQPFTSDTPSTHTYTQDAMLCRPGGGSSGEKEGFLGSLQLWYKTMWSFQYVQKPHSYRDLDQVGLTPEGCLA